MCCKAAAVTGDRSLWRCLEKGGCVDDLPPGTSGATSCLIGCDMYLFGGYTVRGNVNTVYRIDLSPLKRASSYLTADRSVSIERMEPVNGQDAPIASDKNVCWAHDGKLFVFGGYGYEPERGDRLRQLMPPDCLFLADAGSNWVCVSSLSPLASPLTRRRSAELDFLAPRLEQPAGLLRPHHSQVVLPESARPVARAQGRARCSQVGHVRLGLRRTP